MNAVVHHALSQGNINIPPSKSASHRAVLCAALANGESQLHNVGNSADITATIGAMAALGGTLTREGSTLLVRGRVPTANSPITLDCNESGSTLRFLIPLASLTGQEVFLTGSGRLPERPQEVYATLFRERGLYFAQEPRGIRLKGPLPAGHYRLRGDVSSQFITGLLFALPLLVGDSVIEIEPPFESASYVAMTLQILADFGIAVLQDGLKLHIPGGQQIQARDYTVEGDYSQLAFFAALGALGGSVSCLGMSANSLQGDRIILELLRKFGAPPQAISGGWRFDKKALYAQEIDLADCPDLGPILMVLAARANGRTVIRNAGRLRIKESDRIAAMEAELSRCGVRICSTADTVTIEGTPDLSLPECSLSCHNDHRIAMSLAVLAASTPGGPVTLEGAECVRKSYPDFFNDLCRAGIPVEMGKSV